jgi:3-oxoacyl-[acyl-carrier-protein] synthase III
VAPDSVLRILDYGAWNGGKTVDNTMFENRGMSFKGDIPVNDATIQKRIGVRTRVVAPDGERIGVLSFRDLLERSHADLSKTKVVIGATNVGDDKHDPGPQIRHSKDLIRRHCPEAVAFDLFAGCPGFNVSVELLFMLSLGGFLDADDLSIIVGAENAHRAEAFGPQDTASIIFGDDSLTTSLETTVSASPTGSYACQEKTGLRLEEDLVSSIAEVVFRLNGGARPDGLIIDNQLGNLELRVPASAARVQKKLVEMVHEREADDGTLDRFKTALDFYDRNVRSFAFDIMSLDPDPNLVKAIARAYVESGKYQSIVSAFIDRNSTFEVAVHSGKGYRFERPTTGVVDTSTRTHGCFARFIEAVRDAGELFGEMDGKGVFLYATRGAVSHLGELLTANGLTVDEVDLLIEHQANFAMIPATLEQVMDDGRVDVKRAVADFIANRMVTNIHNRGNCSVVCMQRLPYDLQRGALQEDTVQGYVVNGNLDGLQQAKTILFDSVGAGMTRSSFLLKNG